MIKIFFRQFIGFSTAGLLSILIDFMFYYIFLETSLFNSSISKRLSYILGSINSFILNKKIVFKSREKYLREIILFIFIYILSFISNSFLHDSLIEKIPGYLPFLISTLISIIINFLGLKFIVFAK